jgi:hypothetical protein
MVPIERGNFQGSIMHIKTTKKIGGRALTHMMAKCMTLFLLRIEKQGQKKDTFTAEWLTKWRLHVKTPNPPPTYNDSPLEIRIPLPLQHRICIYTHTGSISTPQEL